MLKNPFFSTLKARHVGVWLLKSMTGAMDPYIEPTYSPDRGYLGKVGYFKQAKTQAVAVTTKLPVQL